MIVHRFVFLTPVQLPGKAPASVFEPAAAGNHGHTARRLPEGWLFCGPSGATSGLSASGREELALIGEKPDDVALGVLVPHSQVVVHYAGQWLDDEKLPEAAPSEALGFARTAASQRKAEEQPPPPAPESPPAAPAAPVVAVAAPPPTASRRRTPAGIPAAPPPPPSVGWVDE